MKSDGNQEDSSVVKKPKILMLVFLVRQYLKTSFRSIYFGLSFRTAILFSLPEGVYN